MADDQLPPESSDRPDRGSREVPNLATTTDPVVLRRLQRRWLLENLTSLFLALLLVLMARSSLLEPFKIPSGSMIPTLLVGDYIVVNKAAYGLRLPFSDWIGKQPITLWAGHPPARGDIIVFKYPNDESIFYIKRVIGLPGDTIEIRQKELFINQAKATREPLTLSAAAPIFESFDDPKYGRNNMELYNETLPDGATHLLMLDKLSYFADNYGPSIVPAGKYFVMGDNRDFSNDSRLWGYVPEANIRGRALIVWLSATFPASDGDGKPSWKPERIGTWLH